MKNLRIPYVTSKTIKKHPFNLGDIRVYFLSSDSIGAKSSSIFIKTKDTSILIDPGVAAMQPSYPLNDKYKIKIAEYSRKIILEFAKKAEIVIITHYHYDHFMDPDDAPELYMGKKLYIKNPNIFINKSQWNRARKFFYELLKLTKLNHKIHFLSKNIKKPSINDILTQPSSIKFKNPLESLPIAKNKNFGNYQKRREELLKRGEKWFNKISEQLWQKKPWIKEINNPNISVEYAEGKKLQIGNTYIQFTEPLFHGIEYDRIGWVFGVIISYKGKKLIYTSDIQGPFIEDYAKWIIDENPDLLIMDGPPTYLYGYLINKTNLNRVKVNIDWILQKINAELIVYDHHLTRNSNFKNLFSEIYKKDTFHKLKTTAELFGLQPLILKIKENNKNNFH